MACSEARLAANRANALKSTGPKTEGGKEASRRNALKHGLTGAGVVIPGGDADEAAQLAGPLVLELAGRDGTPAMRLLAERVATLVVRLKRSARHEFAATRERCLDAALDFDAFRMAEAERLFGVLDEGDHRAALLRMPEGVDLLDGHLAALHARAAATGAAGWSREDSDRLARCVSPEARARAEALGRAILDGDASGLDRGLVATLDPANVRGPGAFDQVLGLVEAEREHLASVRSGLDHARIARLREEAVSLALVDDAPATLRARRYEAATERALHRTLREIRDLRGSAPPPSFEPKSAFPPRGELARQAEATRRELARVEPAAAARGAALGSFCPAPASAPVAVHASKLVDAVPARRGQSRYEDRRKRPKLGR